MTHSTTSPLVTLAQAQPAAPVEVAGLPAGASAAAPPVQQGGTTVAPGTAPTGTPGGAPQPQPSPFGGWSLLLPMILVMGILVLTSVMGGRKERKKRDELLRSLSRNDRVQTSGGIIGTVVEMTDSEVVLRVDETTNTRIRFNKSAVVQVVRAHTPGPGPQAEPKPALAGANA